jgi:hypothetical protein
MAQAAGLSYSPTACHDCFGSLKSRPMAARAPQASTVTRAAQALDPKRE